jgi:fructose-1,6-bisphosphatase/inositol monophosphatase family enzyme
MSYNFEELKLFTTELVKRAGEISIKYFNQRDYKKSTKLDGSIVTQADEEIEKLVRDKISQNYPEHNILGEEFGEINNNSDYCWYIDPIDGTKAFAEQIPTFGVMTALTYKDNPFFSVIYQPITKELWLGLLGNKQNIFLYQKDDLDIKIENDQEFDQNKFKVATTSLDLLDAQGNEVFEKNQQSC